MRKLVRIRASLAAVLALTGFLVVTAAEGVDDARRASESRRSVLVGLIRDRQRDVEAHGDTIARLRSDVLAARTRLSTESAGETRRRRAVEVQAGTVGLSGPGLQVTLSDSHRPARNRAEQDALSVHDVDLQMVVNALWAVGAEAIAVNGQRLVATSPIRAAGETITVNFRPLAPPYKIVAIGARAARFEGSATGRRYDRWSRQFGLGFTVAEKDRVEVPGYRGALGVEAAEPLAGRPAEAGEG